MNNEILRMENIVKRFPGVLALDGVTFSVKKGEIHALVGENGAGKSTLMKILAGAIQPDEGKIFLHGKETKIPNTHFAKAVGISIIYQEFNLLPDLTVTQNIFLGQEKNKWGIFLNYREMIREATNLLGEINIYISPTDFIRNLSVAQQQQVEIAKALSTSAEIVIMDEPTASLGQNEVENLFKIIKRLKEKGVTVIYISHRLEEIFHIADSATILKDGKCMGTFPIDELDEEKMIRLMVGRDLSETFPPKNLEVGETMLEVKNLTLSPLFKDINFTINQKEIVGLFGLIGAGRTELAKAIFGAMPFHQGNIYLKGKPLRITSPKSAVVSGICYVPEDRKEEGLCLELSVEENVILPYLEKSDQGPILKNSVLRKKVSNLVDNLAIKTPSLQQKVKFLSGGNQQKVVLAKWLITEPHLIIFDEPTRGIDVGAKTEIYHLMRELANQGNAILMISSELPEIIGMSDRVLVMHEGKMVKEFKALEEVDEEKIMHYATGIFKSE